MTNSELGGYPKIDAVTDFFNPEFREFNQDVWISGVPVNAEFMRGKQEVVAQLESLLLAHGAAILEGGFRTGKSTILRAIGSALETRGIVSKLVEVPYIPENDSFAIDVVNLARKHYGQEARFCITVDEVTAGNKNVLPFVQYLLELKKQGHKVLLATQGDFQHHPGTIPAVAEALNELAPDATVINSSFSDDEIREIIRLPGKVFSQDVEDFLVREAGGHALLAQLLCSTLMEKVRAHRIGRLATADILPALEKALIGDQQNPDDSSLLETNLDQPVNFVTTAGFNPITWEFTGNPQLNKSVYVNMLPRTSARIFRKWLEQRSSQQQTPEKRKGLLDRFLKRK